MQREDATTARVTLGDAGTEFCLFVVSLLLVGCGSASHRMLEQTIDQTYQVDRTVNISIRNRDGSVRVYGANTTEVKLQAIKKAYSAERLNGIAVKISAQPGSVSIDTSYPSGKRSLFSDNSGTVDYVIVVPDTARITRLELANGELLLEGMRGPAAQAHLGNGRLLAHNCFGNLDVTVSTGNLGLVYDWWEQRKFAVHANIADGNVLAFIPSDATFHLIAEALNGKIANDFTEKEQRHGEQPGRVDMLVGGSGDVSIEIRATDGNIKISEANP